MLVRRKIEDEREAVEFLQAAEQKGMSVRDWAQAHGVDGRSLRAWQINIGRRGTAKPRRPRKMRTKAPPTAHALVELVPDTKAAVQGLARYALLVGSARIEFGDDASAATLRRVLEVLRSC